MTTKKTAASLVPATSKKVSAKKAASSATNAVVKAGAAVPVAKAARTATAAKKPKKESKVKVVRDSFTMPQNEYVKIAEIKEAALQAGTPVKKSEVLRAGLKALAAMSPAQLKRALAGLEKIKTGRPKKP